MMGRLFLIIGSLGGLATVILGAFGAHALEGQLSAQQLTWWHKAVNYQGLHSLALLATGMLGKILGPPLFAFLAFMASLFSIPLGFARYII